ncbi:MAG: hypothetical protein FJ118_06345 [Deltaproteobacteria bacterium]|nr:hypothetical protein [Deltaproteobacteria bacterium]
MRRDRDPREASRIVARRSSGLLTTFSFRGIWRIPAALLFAVLVAGCGYFTLGKYRGIEWTPGDEAYYLLKDVLLSAGSSLHPRKSFDHTMQDSVVASFITKDEKFHYVTKTIWKDPSGLEFRTIRQTHKLQEEKEESVERPKDGIRRIHSLSTKELFAHKPGLWTVEIYIDDKLARRLNFSVF